MHGNFISNIGAVERMIETYTNQYTAQQRAPAKGNSTKRRNNRPRNASMVSGSTTKPKNTQRNRPVNGASMVSGAAGSTRPNQPNHTRKKPWWEKRREKQAAKRNQTRRSGPNVPPVIPTL
jgi:hypothetical protein